MFSTLKMRLLLALYIFLIISIPVGAYLASQQQTIKSRANEEVKKPITKTDPKPTTSPAKELLGSSESNLEKSPSGSSESPNSPTIATSFGPTLSLKAILEGRPINNQATKLFIGIIEGGNLTSNPKFLLSFTVDLPANGTYANLSLAGLNSGSQYTALLKGSAQIATSSAFIMSPTVSSLNSGQAVNLKTGDLNEDNVVNSADYTIAQAILGATPSSSKWNTNADFNKDSIINVFDLGIISKNLGQVGATGAWTSPIPKTSTPSASLSTPATGGIEQESEKGYWLWIPK